MAPGEFLTANEWRERAARNFIAPFLRDGWRVRWNSGTGAVWFVPCEGGEVSPEVERMLQLHAPALRRIAERNRAATCENRHSDK